MDLNSVVYLKALSLSNEVPNEVLFFQIARPQKGFWKLDWDQSYGHWESGYWTLVWTVKRLGISQRATLSLSLNHEYFMEDWLGVHHGPHSNTPRIQASKNSRAWSMHILKYAKHFSWRTELMVGGSDNSRLSFAV